MLFRKAASPNALNGLRFPYSRFVRPALRAPALSRPDYQSCRLQHTVPTADGIPLRKQLKESAKAAKKAAKAAKNNPQGGNAIDPLLSKWELTVGIEVHAELNTARKLFSAARTSSNAEPNTHVALFDLAMPGSQPHFQHATLIPALRAALALKCEIQKRSSWDRKHYFYQDQPNGYQITQYYEPFARNGTLPLTLSDGISPTDLAPGSQSLEIGIKQVQMEQDTAKTTHTPPSTYLLDFNRVSHPLIEIITLPQIHSPQTAAAVVRKIQSLLKSIDSCVAGMETGGLRADVNVSVRQRGEESEAGLQYGGVKGLGQRTEIKNLSSFKAVEDAVTSERDRQIRVLEEGGVIEGETRGWTIGSTETVRLRGKEGEVDYRYMPDPDLAPVLISEALVERLRDTLPETVEGVVERVQRDFGASEKDAKTLLAFDDGERVEFCASVVDEVERMLGEERIERTKVGRAAVNWVLHELGGLLTSDGRDWEEMNVSPTDLAAILTNLLRKQITARTAKQLLQQIYTGENDGKGVEQIIDEGNLRLRPLGEEEYVQLAQSIMNENETMVAAIREKGQKGKAMWFVGQMVRRGEEGTVEAEKAKEVVERLLGI